MGDVVKKVKPLEESCSLIKSISETIENEAKEQKGEFLPMILGKIAAGLLGNMLAGKRVIRASEGVIRAREGKDF